MNPSKWLFCLLLVIAGHGSTSQSQNLCSVQSITYSAVMGRAFSIEFPGGPTIRVVGHQHGDRDVQGKILGTLANSNLSDAEATAITRPLISSLSPTLAQYRGDVGYLTNVLAKNPETVLWAEGSENALIQIRAFLASAAKLRNGSEFDDALLLAGGPILYLEVGGKLPSSAQVKGVEDINSDIEMDWKKADDLKADSLSFSEIEKENAHALHSVVPLIDEWNKLLESGEVDQLLKYDETKIDQAVDAGGFSEQIARSLKMRLRAYLIEHQSSIKRDRANIQKMIHQNGSEVFLVGLLHVDPTLTLLQRSCENGR